MFGRILKENNYMKKRWFTIIVKIVSYVIYICCLFTIAGILHYAGYGLDTWQRWVGFSCVIVAFICGEFYNHDGF